MVLVILAILAAIMVPQLTGYIDKAKNKQYEVRCRNLLIAAQTIVDEEYAKAPVGATKTFKAEDKLTDDPTTGVFEAIKTLAEETGTGTDSVSINKLVTGEKYKITEMEITFGSGSDARTASYDSGTWDYNATKSA